MKKYWREISLLFLVAIMVMVVGCRAGAPVKSVDIDPEHSIEKTEYDDIRHINIHTRDGWGSVNNNMTVLLEPEECEYIYNDITNKKNTEGTLSQTDCESMINLADDIKEDKRRSWQYQGHVYDAIHVDMNIHFSKTVSCHVYISSIRNADEIPEAMGRSEIKDNIYEIYTIARQYAGLDNETCLLCLTNCWRYNITRLFRKGHTAIQCQ